jgi:hypothetical protein
MILDDSFTVTLPGGSVVTIPWWTVGIAGVAIAVTLAALAIWVTARLLNRRDDSRHSAATHKRN